MAERPADDSALVSLYRERITEPSTDDEVYGYWLFVAGLVASVIGVALFLYSSTLVTQRPPVAEPATFWTVRQLAIVLAAGGVPLMLGGIALRLPLRNLATYLTYGGMALCLLALVWFLTVYPADWTFATGNTGVIALYVLGLVVIAAGAVLVPMLSRAETETASERETREAAEREGAETREELASTREERDEARTSAEASAAELEALRQSQARFELFEDRAGGYRWRLRHRNGNIIADSAEAYASRQKCQQGMHSVMRNALGAEVRIIEPEDPEEAAEEVETEPIEYESQASFELYEDNAGDYRWRLVHDNGNILADSGEGYASKSNAKRAMAGVREHAAAGDYLKIDPAGFEVYRDKAGQWRWRLVHENGNILADSGEGYASRQKARQGLDSVRTNAGDADIEEQ
nr:HVO_2922 family protein [Natronomonas halophila]